MDLCGSHHMRMLWSHKYKGPGQIIFFFEKCHFISVLQNMSKVSIKWSTEFHIHFIFYCFVALSSTLFEMNMNTCSLCLANFLNQLIRFNWNWTAIDIWFIFILINYFMKFSYSRLASLIRKKKIHTTCLEWMILISCFLWSQLRTYYNFYFK